MVILISMPRTPIGSGLPLSKPTLISWGITAGVLLGVYFTVPLTARALAIDLPSFFGLAVSPEASQIFYMFLTVLTGGLGISAAVILATELPPRWWIWAALGVLFLIAVLWVPVLSTSLDALNAEYCREFTEALADSYSTGHSSVRGCSGY